MEAAIEKGRSLPDWYLDEPALEPGDYFYMMAFSDLNSGRQMGFGVGEIPWRDIMAYADRADLDFIMADVFKIVIRQMDRTYMKWQDGERDKMRRSKERTAKSASRRTMPKEDYLG